MKQFHLDKAGNTPKDANFVLGTSDKLILLEAW